MSLRVAVAAPFKGAGTDRLPESEFVVALSIDRDWFSPDEASRAVELAVDRDLLAREGDDLRAQFDPGEVPVPADFEPGADVLREQTVFESILERIVAAGAEKGAAVAAINERSTELGVTPAAAAVLEARRRGLDVGDAAERALAELSTGGESDDAADSDDSEEANAADAGEETDEGDDSEEANAAEGDDGDAGEGEEANAAEGDEADAGDGEETDTDAGDDGDAGEGDEADSDDGEEADADDGEEADANDSEEVNADDGDEETDAADEDTPDGQ